MDAVPSRRSAAGAGSARSSTWEAGGGRGAGGHLGASAAAAAAAAWRRPDEALRARLWARQECAPWCIQGRAAPAPLPRSPAGWQACPGRHLHHRQYGLRRSSSTARRCRGHSAREQTCPAAPTPGGTPPAGVHLAGAGTTPQRGPAPAAVRRAPAQRGGGRRGHFEAATHAAAVNMHEHEAACTSHRRIDLAVCPSVCTVRTLATAAVLGTTPLCRWGAGDAGAATLLGSDEADLALQRSLPGLRSAQGPSLGLRAHAIVSVSTPLSRAVQGSIESNGGAHFF